MQTAESKSLLANLAYEPKVLKFGTSGRRGEVVDLTQLEIYLNALAELEYLQSLPGSEGGIRKGEEFYFAYDLRPSSTRFVAEQGGRGEIAQAIEQAIREAGMRPVNLGAIPTPALTFYALQQGRGSIMITGSHIPFDRNGFKTNSAKGELLKKDEGPIAARVEEVRQRVYAQPFQASLFNSMGLFKDGHRELSPVNDAAREAYLARYCEFFSGQSLRNKRFLVYEHSAVGRDLLREILARLGAEVIAAGRSDTFVPIDTENIDDQQLQLIQNMADAAWKQHGPLDAVVSMDGDSDRPLLLGVNSSPDGASGRVQFFGGDLVGMIVAEFLGAGAVVVPISCNDALDRGPLQRFLQPKTRIGSPHVIAGMEKARQAGRKAVCGWEANGGFLTGSDIIRNGKVLKALPTRDAVLPLLSVLLSAVEKNASVSELFRRLPPRYSRAALLKKFPRAMSLRIVEKFTPADPAIREIAFTQSSVRTLDESGSDLPGAVPVTALQEIRQMLEKFFTGFGPVIRINYTDGVRIYFENGDVAHVRPSGNADELRIYAVADTQARADEITRLGVKEPDGILRRMERAVA